MPAPSSADRTVADPGRGDRSVDTRTEVQIQQADGAAAQGRTSFVIAHRLSTIRNANSIEVMEPGRIVEQGSHTELLARRASTTGSTRASSPTLSP